MKVLFVITARGGSKGVPRKNIIQLGEYPLIAYKIISAKKCRYEKRVIVSTEDMEIADVARKYGAEVPFMRPLELATDTADSMDVVMHAINWVEENDRDEYDYICLLEPSSPFSTYEDLDNAIELIESSKVDTILGMKEVEVSRDFVHELDSKGQLSYFYEAIKKLSGIRRQDQRPQYTMNGCLYLARKEYFIENKMFHSMNSLPYIMPWESSIEIDTLQDLYLAEYVLKNKLIDISYWKEVIGC